MANAIFSCPKCKQILADIPPQGILTAVCGDCRLRYQVVRGRVTAAEATGSTISPATLGGSAVSEWSYVIRLSLANGRSELIEFKLTEPDTFAAHNGDIVSAVFLMRGTARETLLSVHNGTLGERIVLAFPGAGVEKKAWMIAGGLGAATFVVLGSITGLPGVAFFIGGVSALGAGTVMRHRLMPRVFVSADERARLTATQQMLAQKIDLEEARSRVEQGMESRAELRERLVSLRAKMERLGLEVYAPRIAAMNKGIATINEQLALDAKLRDAYDKSVSMLEIELEAGVAVNAMEGMDAPHIAATFAEMRDLENRQRELTRQIEANAEVEGLLRGGT